MPRHNYDRALPAFRPSVYTTGIQGIQPYNAGWPQGVGYGGTENDTSWYDIFNPWTAAKTYTSGAKGLLSAAQSSLQAVNQGYAQYEAQKAAEEAERKRLEEEAQRMLLLKVGAFLVVGVGGYVAVSRYRRNGSVFGKAVGA